ncbi:MAG: HAD family hydrolase [Pirellulaceae bacterium]
MLVLLFDIDGTLIHTGGAGGAALRQAFRTLFDIAEPRDVPYSGRTDRAISRDMFTLHQVEDSPANWERLRTGYLTALAESLAACRGCVLPGISLLLEKLATHPDVAVGLLTGNLQDGARLKLQHYGLARHFAFGGYGDEHFDRDDVAVSALAAAHQHLKGRREPRRVWVIGDTPLDIRCARRIQAHVLAVATGTHPRGELADHRPDALLNDLADVDGVLELLMDTSSATMPPVSG